MNIFLIAFFLRVCEAQIAKITNAREAFESSFAKLYTARSNTTAPDNTLVLPDVPGPLQDADLQHHSRFAAKRLEHVVTDGARLETDCTKQNGFNVDWSKWSDMLDGTYERYEKLIEEGKLAKVFVAGNSKEQIDAAANYVFERYGAPLVDEILEKLGAAGGREAGMYVGGELGIVLGVFAPELAVPLVVGSVFLGGRFGSFLGKWAGKIGAYFANDLIEEDVIDPLVEEALSSFIGNYTKNVTKDDDAVCDHNLCWAGTYDRTPKGCSRDCYSCNGLQDYSDSDGAAGACKQCPGGSVASGRDLQDLDEHDHCSECNAGFGWYEGKGCLNCDGMMEYSDVRGSVGCKMCEPGSIGRSSNDVSHWMEHDHCSKCNKGFGWYKDKGCIQCDGLMEYSDVEGSVGCKICEPGSIGRSSNDVSHWMEHDHCSKCSKGFGWYKDKGCIQCDGLMEYSDVEGSVGCKICEPGSVGRSSNDVAHWMEHGHCSKCNKGYGWYRDRGCLACDGDSQYQDDYGGVGCKDCPAGERGRDPTFGGANTECVKARSGPE